MNEIWKKIEGFEEFYEVSSFGNVRSIDREIIDKKGNKFKKKEKNLVLELLKQKTVTDNRGIK